MAQTICHAMCVQTWRRCCSSCDVLIRQGQLASSCVTRLLIHYTTPQRLTMKFYDDIGSFIRFLRLFFWTLIIFRDQGYRNWPNDNIIWTTQSPYLITVLKFRWQWGRSNWCFVNLWVRQWLTVLNISLGTHDRSYGHPWAPTASHANARWRSWHPTQPSTCIRYRVYGIPRAPTQGVVGSHGIYRATEHGSNAGCHGMPRDLP